MTATIVLSGEQAKRTPIYGSHDPDTSRIAAESSNRDSLRTRVHNLLTAFGPMTDWELWFLLDDPNVDKPSVVNRRRECGAVDTGERRPSPKGRPCVVWTLPGGGGGS